MHFFSEQLQLSGRPYLAAGPARFLRKGDLVRGHKVRERIRVLVETIEAIIRDRRGVWPRCVFGASRFFVIRFRVVARTVISLFGIVSITTRAEKLATRNARGALVNFSTRKSFLPLRIIVSVGSYHRIIETPGRKN